MGRNRSPLFDPLQLNYDVDENYHHYGRLCREAERAESQNDPDVLEEHWQGIKLRDLAQKLQNDWYGQWVGEMVRIAKPGVPVIVEQVSQEFCNVRIDWGGVDQSWWATAIDTYGWDIDPSSIEFMDDTIFKKRYHVFMRKNGFTQFQPGE